MQLQNTQLECQTGGVVNSPPRERRPASPCADAVLIRTTSQLRAEPARQTEVSLDTQEVPEGTALEGTVPRQTEPPPELTDPAGTRPDRFAFELPRCCDAAGIHISACLESGVPLPTSVRQLSRTDVLLQTDRPLRFGTRIRLALYIDYSASASNVAVVHWCRPGREGWELGAFLTTPLADHLVAKTRGGLRSQIRYESNWRAWIRWEHSERRYPVQVTDYSISGVRLRFSGTADRGQSFWLFQTSATSAMPLLKGLVQWSRSDTQGTTLGCYVGNERARCLPRAFNQASVLHVEVPDLALAGSSNMLAPYDMECSDDNRLV